MPRRLEFFFDYVSPFSYLANSQVEAIAARTGAELVYRPFLLGGVMQATGNQPPATLPARGKYMPKDIGRWVRRYGIPFAFNPSFPMKTLDAMRAALAAQEQGVFPAYHAALFKAAWAEPANLADPAVLRDLIAEGRARSPSRSSRPPRPSRSRRSSRPTRPRRSSAARSARRPSSSATRSSSATTGSTSSKKRCARDRGSRRGRDGRGRRARLWGGAPLRREGFVACLVRRHASRPPRVCSHPLRSPRATGRCTPAAQRVELRARRAPVGREVLSSG